MIWPKVVVAKWGWRDAVLAAQVVVQTGILYLLGSGGYFYQDDFLNMQMAVHTPLTLRYLMTPIFVHLEPGVRLEYWILVHLFAAHYRIAFGYIAILIGLTSWILYLLVRRIYAPTWWAPLLLLLSGLWVGWMTAAPWLASGLEVTPSVLAGTCAAYAFWRRIEGGGDRWTAATGLSFAAGLAFYEGTMVTIPVLVLMVPVGATLLGSGPFQTRVKIVARRAAAPMAWCCFVAAVFVAVDFLKGGVVLSQSPSPWMMILFLGRAWYFAYIPSLFGGPLDWSWVGAQGNAAGPLWLAAASQVALAILLLYTIRRSRAQALAGWALVVLPFILLMALIGWARAVEFGVAAGQDYRYEANLVVPLVLGMAFVLIGRKHHANGGQPHSSRLKVATATAVGLLYVAIFSASALPASARWTSSGTRSYVTDLRASFLALSSRAPGTWGVYTTAVPPAILFSQAWPYTQVRTIGLPWGVLLPPPRLGAKMYVVDEQGRLVPGHLRPVAAAVARCAGPASSLPFELSASVPAGVWQVALTYTSNEATVVKLAIVGGPGNVASGVLGTAYLSAPQGSVVIPTYWPKRFRRIELLTGPDATVCFDRVEVATAVATP